MEILKPTLYPIDCAGPGQLAISARPRGGDWLLEEMRDLRDSGANVVLSMLTAAEADSLDLGSEEEAARSVGLEFISFPTPDRGTPGVAEFRDLIQDLDAALKDGKHIVVHCRMGIGRSSLVAAGLLIAQGVSAPDAWSIIAESRGLVVPDTEEQREWLEAINER